VLRFKVVDDAGNVHAVDTDAAGRPVGREAVEQAIRQVGHAGFVGKVETALASRMAAQGEAATTNVVYWVRRAGTVEPLRGDDVTEDEYEARLAAVSARMAAVQQPLVDHLRATGHRVIYRARYAPAVVATSSTAGIRAAESRGDVERIYLERVHQPRLNISRAVVQATTVNGRGFIGTGERVGVVEPGRIAAHPNLPAAQRILCRPGAAAFTSGHKTNVAGVIQSNHGVRRGMARGITIVDGIGANFSDAEMMAATDCVIAQGATAINMSFGSETNGVFDPFARFVDSTAYFTGRTIVPAISNVCGNRMGSPEIAFNALAVGAFGDGNTTGFANDVPACTGAVTFSAFLDPLSVHGDREEPDVVAPGHLIDTTNAAGGFSNANGTSFAAPHVTGGVGLLRDRLAALHTQTERVRAIVMAAARHNLEGATRLSERDGAGGLMLAAADRVLINNQSFFFTAPGGTTGFPINQTFTATAGQTVRVAIAWAHKSPGGDALTQPTTDLDLAVRAPGGASMGASLSFDNSYEIVEFRAPVSGVYTATISNFRASEGAEFIGLAVSRTNT
jgi:hypothetical protein